MAHPHHCLVTQKLQSTYFNVLHVYFIIGPNVGSHYGRQLQTNAVSTPQCIFGSHHLLDTMLLALTSIFHVL